MARLGYFVQKLERLGDVAAEGERGEEDPARLRAFIFTERSAQRRLGLGRGVRSSITRAPLASSGTNLSAMRS